MTAERAGASAGASSFRDGALGHDGGLAFPGTGVRPEVREATGPRLSVARRYRSIGIGQAASDAACIALALVLAAPRIGALTLDSPPLWMDAKLLLACAAWVLIFHACGLYSPQHLSAPDEFRRAIGASSAGMILVVFITASSTQPFSRWGAALTWAIALGLELVTRRAWRWHQGRLKADGRLEFATVVVGGGNESIRLIGELTEVGSGFAPIGCVRFDETPTQGSTHHILGDAENLEAIVRDYGVECLFVASTEVNAAQVGKITQLGRQEGLEIRLSANAPQILTSRLALQPIGSVMALSVKPARLSQWQSALKRMFDIVVGSASLLIALPFAIPIAVAIKLTSRGPVLFRQERATKGGRPFSMCKFRTMVVDGDEVLADLAIDPSEPFFKMASDPRLTKVGRIIRSFSLDEIPQLLNVIRGDMSLVGPRPLPMDQVTANWEMLSPRLEVPAGVTGWWQVNGRSDLDPQEAIQLDLFYIENWSLSLDVYILLKTAGAVLFRRGAV